MTDRSAMKISHRATGSLVPYARNSRTHPKAQIAQIVESINQWGWTNPVLIDEAGRIIAGHGRVMAAQELGMAKVPCIVLAGLTEAQKRAYTVADNSIALNSGWNEDLLREELMSLAEEDFDLDLLGFDDVKMVKFLARTPAPAEDDAADLSEPVTSRKGDVWILGDHQLIVGDAPDADDIVVYWQEITNEVAHHKSGGTFDKIRADRAAPPKPVKRRPSTS